MSSSDDDYSCYTNTAALLTKAYNTAKRNVPMQDLLAGFDSPKHDKSPKKSNKNIKDKISEISDEEEISGSQKKCLKETTDKISVILDKKCDSQSKHMDDVVDVELNEKKSMQPSNDTIMKVDCELMQLSDSPSDIGSVVAKIDACIAASKLRSRRKASDWKTNTTVKSGKAKKSRRSSRRGRGRYGIWQYDDEDTNLPPLFEKNTTKTNVTCEKKSSNMTNLDEVNPVSTVKVWWRLQSIDKFEIRRFQKLDSIFEYYAKQESITEDRLIFTLKDKVIKKGDTPDSLALGVSSVIEGGVLTKSLDLPIQTTSKRKGNSHSKLEFKIQQKDCKTPLLITIQKTDVMATLYAKIAEDVKLPLAGFKLYFDGDAINPTHKPEDLELEGGECLDLIVV